MPQTSKIRERLIKVILEGAISKRTLLARFNRSYRNQAEQELNILLSKGIAVQVGLGRRGNPYTIQPSHTYPFDRRCPLCRQELPQTEAPCLSKT